MSEVEIVSPKRDRKANLIPIKPGEVRNPTGTNGLHAFSRELREAGCLEDVKRVLKRGMSEESEPQIQLHAAALTLKYILGVPEGEINDKKKEKGFNWSDLTDDQRKFLFAIRDALARRAAEGNSGASTVGGSVHPGSSGSSASQVESR